MSDSMNEFAKALASGMPRRKLFKLAIGAAAASVGTTLAGVLKPLGVGAVPELSPTRIFANPATGYYGGSVDLSAELEWEPINVNLSMPRLCPLGNQDLAFFVLGNPEGMAPTNVNGVATLSNVSLGDLDAGLYPSGIFVNYAGNVNYQPSFNYAGLNILPAPTSLSVEPASGFYDGTADLSAQLMTLAVNGYEPFFNQSLDFHLLNYDVGSALTNINGVATIVNASLVGIDPGVYFSGVFVNYAGDNNHQAVAAGNQLTVLSLHGVVPLYNTSTVFRRPQWADIRIMVTDDQGNNVSSRDLLVTTVSLTREGGPTVPYVRPALFDRSVAPGGGYDILVGTFYLAPGTYTLELRIEGDPETYSVEFTIR